MSLTFAIPLFDINEEENELQLTKEITHQWSTTIEIADVGDKRE